MKNTSILWKYKINNIEIKTNYGKNLNCDGVDFDGFHT